MRQFDPHRDVARELQRLGMTTTADLRRTRLYLAGHQVHGPPEDVAALELILDKRQCALRRKA